VSLPRSGRRAETVSGSAAVQLYARTARAVATAAASDILGVAGDYTHARLLNLNRWTLMRRAAATASAKRVKNTDPQGHVAWLDLDVTKPLEITWSSGRRASSVSVIKKEQPSSYRDRSAMPVPCVLVVPVQF
jgi:hypothetical protein